MMRIAVATLRTVAAMLACGLAAHGSAVSQAMGGNSPQIICQGAFKRGDSRVLDEAYANYRALPPGRAQRASEECVEALSVYVQGDDAPGWVAMDKKTTDWVVSSPHSAVARLARAKALLFKARMVENAGRQWTEVDKYLLEAARVLDAQAVSARDGNWYALKLELAKLQGASSGEVVETVKALLEADPYSFAAVDAAIVALDTERGRGDPRLVEWMAQAVAAKTRSTEGRARYARIYQQAAVSFYQLRMSPFLSGRADWQTLHQGFLDLEKKSPQDYSMDLHAGFACLAKDRKVTTELLRRIGAKVDRTAWFLGPGPNWAMGRHHDQCKEWVERGERAT